jgi:hypothetical protein
MGTFHLDPASSSIEQSGVPRRAIVPAIRWGAVLAGVAVGISTQLVLTLLGIASGLSTTNVAQGEMPGSGALIWAGVSMLIAAFVGGYVAARMTGLKRKADGILHGVVSWAVTTLLFAGLATSTGGAMVSGVFSAMNSAAVAAASGQGGGMAGMLKSRVGNSASPENLKTLQGYIAQGQREQAIQYMSATMGVEGNRAAPIVDQALILGGMPERASPEARVAADRAAEAAGNAAWVVFLAVALSLGLGIAGGALGAVGARRTTWTTTRGVADAPPLAAERPAGRRPL